MYIEPETEAEVTPTHGVVTSPLSPDEAFAEIGKLMSTWVALLPGRDNAHNNIVMDKVAVFGGRPSFDRTRLENERMDALRASLRSVRSVAFLKSTIPGVSLVLSGSNKMDTGSAFMLIGSYADLSLAEDIAVSTSLVELTKVARPVPQDSAAPKVTTELPTKPTAARRSHRRKP